MALKEGTFFVGIKYDDPEDPDVYVDWEKPVPNLPAAIKGIAVEAHDLPKDERNFVQYVVIRIEKIVRPLEVGK